CAPIPNPRSAISRTSAQSINGRTGTLVDCPGHWLSRPQNPLITKTVAGKPYRSSAGAAAVRKLRNPSSKVMATAPRLLRMSLKGTTSSRLAAIALNWRSNSSAEVDITEPEPSIEWYIRIADLLPGIWFPEGAQCAGKFSGCLQNAQQKNHREREGESHPVAALARDGGANTHRHD